MKSSLFQNFTQAWQRIIQCYHFAVKPLHFVLWVFALISFCACRSGGEKDSSGQLVLVCGDSKVLLVDCSGSKDSIPDIVWSWDAHESTDLPSDYRINRFNSVDDCKAINNGSQIMVSSSGGAIAIVNRTDKKVTFFAEVPNAHSIEILPGNRIVAAASTAKEGNRVMLFNINQPGEVLFSDSLYSAHGLVWDSQRNSLFALGYDVLREYKLQDGDILLLTSEWNIPGIGGHDLQMGPDGNKLLMTEHTGAWIFDVESEKFSKIDGFPDAENIKSINQNSSGRYVYTVPEESWWTFHVRFFNPEGVLAFPSMKVYKARWYN